MKNPDILTQSEFQSRIIPISFNGYEKKVMPAGSPVNAKGQFANDGSAIGILLDDVTREYPYGEAIISGFVDYEVAQNHAGIQYTKECMTALKNIVFEGSEDKWVAGGSDGSGGAAGEVSWNDIKDKPFGEMNGQLDLLSAVTFNGPSASGTIDPSLFEVRENTNVFVELDGETYECPIKLDTYGYVNGEVIIKDSGETFNFYVEYQLGDDIGSYTINVQNSADEHTFRIYVIEDYIKKLSIEYLPDHTHDYSKLNRIPISMSSEYITMGLNGYSEDNENNITIGGKLYYHVAVDDPVGAGKYLNGATVYCRLWDDDSANDENVRVGLVTALSPTASSPYSESDIVERLTVYSILKDGAHSNEAMTTFPLKGYYIQAPTKDNEGNPISKIPSSAFRGHGGYKQLSKNLISAAPYIPNATGETVTVEEFNALLESLRTGGYLRY